MVLFLDNDKLNYAELLLFSIFLNFIFILIFSFSKQFFIFLLGLSKDFNIDKFILKKRFVVSFNDSDLNLVKFIISYMKSLIERNQNTFEEKKLFDTRRLSLFYLGTSTTLTHGISETSPL